MLQFSFNNVRKNLSNIDVKTIFFLLDNIVQLSFEWWKCVEESVIL